jgi:hypothetical protein
MLASATSLCRLDLPLCCIWNWSLIVDRLANPAGWIAVWTDVFLLFVRNQFRPALGFQCYSTRSSVWCRDVFFRRLAVFGSAHCSC